MSTISFSVEAINTIDPQVAPNYGTRSLNLQCAMNDDQMIDALTQLQEAVSPERWAAWINEEE
jgi:hypothetical protein